MGGDLFRSDPNMPFDPEQPTSQLEMPSNSSWSTNLAQASNYEPTFRDSEPAYGLNEFFVSTGLGNSQLMGHRPLENELTLTAQTTQSGIQQSKLPFNQPITNDWFQDPYAFSHSYLQQATAIQQESSNNQQKPNLWSDPSSGLGSFEQVSGLNDNPIMAPVASSLFGLQTSHT